MNKNLSELRELAKKYNIKGISKYRKPELIELLNKDIKVRKLSITQHEKIFNALGRNYNRIDSLLDRIFDLSRLRRGLFELNIQQVNLKEILEISVNDMKKLVEKKGLDISFIDKVSDDFYLAQIDPSLLDQVIRNLIQNSIKFTEKGEIIVTLTTINRD